MKKRFFTCFHPLVLEPETETDQENIHPTISPSRKKGPFSKVLEILLLKASLKIKVSDRNCRQLLLQPKNATLRRISRHLHISKARKDEGVEEAKVSQTRIRSSGSSRSFSDESKNTRSSMVERPRLSPSSDHQESGDGSREFRLMTEPCSCRINPGLYLIVATLFFTVVWGRVRAVLFALVFLYLVPFRAGFLQ